MKSFEYIGTCGYVKFCMTYKGWVVKVKKKVSAKKISVSRRFQLKIILHDHDCLLRRMNINIFTQ